MYYKFKRTMSKDYVCIVEADNLKEAKNKANGECDWDEDGDGESYCSMYWGFTPYLEDGMKQEDVDEDYADNCEWDGIRDDPDFFSYFK